VLPTLDALAREAATCVLCRLSEGRTNVVFGMGDPAAPLMFIGEGPGEQEDKQGLADIIARLTAAPARIMAIDAGDLATGRVADVCIFDPSAFWPVERSALKSQGKNTPFLGLEVPGKVRYTLVGGQVVFEA